MIEILGPALAIALTAQSVPLSTTLALMLRDRTVIMERADAEMLRVELQGRQIKFGLSEEERRRLAAVEIALGSIPDQCTIEQERASLCLRPNRTE